MGRRAFRAYAILGWICVVGTGAAGVGTGCDRTGTKSRPATPAATPGARRSADLAADRAGFATRLVRRGPAPQDYEVEAPPSGVREVRYPSGNLSLKAWVSEGGSAGGQGRRPAVVWVHGGFAFGRDDWDETQPYRDAGFVVMVPMLRGENGNPGDFEMYYGEVDDAVAAGKYVAALPYVDPARVYVAGHSSGGAVSVLVSVLPSPFAAAAPVGGYVDMAALARYLTGARSIPFDGSDPREFRVRSAMHYAGSLRCPTRLFVGDGDPLARHGADAFAADATAAGHTCELVVLPGGHMESKPEAIRRSAEWFAGLARGR